MIRTWGWMIVVVMGNIILLTVPCRAQSRRRSSTCIAENACPAITQVVSKAQLTASDGASNNEFGASVAINSSGNTIVVGAPDEDDFEGGVYVFVEPAGGWANAVQTTKLTVADLNFDAQFGEAVAITADGSMIVASSPGNDVTGGSIYVFSPTDGNWSNGGTLIATLIASDGLAGINLGSSLAITSNGETIVAGAVLANDEEGAVYVYAEPSGGWTNMNQQTAKLTASNPTPSQNLGNAVAISGNTIAAGAWDYDEGRGGPGSVYVYTKPASGWTNMTQTAELTASDGRDLDILGSSVGISGNTIVAGAPNHAVGSNTDQGALYVFAEPPTGWANGFQTAELTAANGVEDAVLGSSVAISGGFIVGGAYCQEVGSNTCQGEVYAYVKPTGGWANGKESYDLTAKGGSAGDELGWSASFAATGSVAISSALGYESYRGAVYVFK